MTDEQIRIKLALLDGWEKIEQDSEVQEFRRFMDKSTGFVVTESQLPDYLEDLNAIRPVEISAIAQRPGYWNRYKENIRHQCEGVCHPQIASARHRAYALMDTLHPRPGCWGAYSKILPERYRT